MQFFDSDRTFIRPEGYNPCAGHSVITKSQPETEVEADLTKE